jgi:Cu+-exporting ATPase
VGFSAVEEDKSDVVLSIGGMTCAACVNTIESVLRGTPGVASASVNLLTGKAKVSFGKNSVGVRDLIENVEEVGFEASVCRDKSPLDVFRKLTEIEYYRRSLWAAVAFNVVFLGVMALHQIPAVHQWFEVSEQRQ